ncbi:hypothetical protein DSO57_1016651 [Entomophthora muscae]|nr:hypothetical protein DSO57_1016651 [Entomophthora muscae]
MPSIHETPVIRIEVQQPPPAPTVTQTITRMVTVMSTETQIIHRFIDPSTPQPTGTFDPKEHQRVAILVTDTPTRTHYSHQMGNLTLPDSHHKKPFPQDTD